jgi:hypothetical protein
MIMELSYFKLRLIAFLKESHPDIVNDRQFIRHRSELVSQAYCNAIQSGQNPIEAEEAANAELIRGLHFSKYTTLFEILSEEFADTVRDENVHQYALELLSLCRGIFSKYSLDDGFSDTPEYRKLYTELTGKIVAYGL